MVHIAGQVPIHQSNSAMMGMRSLGRSAIRLFSQMTVDVFAVSYPNNDYEQFPFLDLIYDTVVSRTDAIKFFFCIEYLASGRARINC